MKDGEIPRIPGDSDLFQREIDMLVTDTQERGYSSVPFIGAYSPGRKVWHPFVIGESPETFEFAADYDMYGCLISEAFEARIGIRHKGNRLYLDSKGANLSETDGPIATLEDCTSEERALLEEQGIETLAELNRLHMEGIRPLGSVIYSGEYRFGATDEELARVSEKHHPKLILERGLWSMQNSLS